MTHIEKEREVFQEYEASFQKLSQLLEHISAFTKELESHNRVAQEVLQELEIVRQKSEHAEREIHRLVEMSQRKKE